MNVVRGIYSVVTDFAHQWKEKSADLAKIEGAIYYIKGVELVRRLLVAIYFLLGSFLMLIFGLIMVHVTLLLFIPLSPLWHLYVASALTLLDFFIAIFIALTLFSQKNWLKFTKSSEMMEGIVAKNSAHSEQEDI